jgi:hypothetical protein
MGLGAAIFLGTTPIFFAQSVMVMGDLPIASLGVASVYFLLTERFWAYVVIAKLLLQTKETALAVSVAAALYDLFRHRSEAGRQRVFIKHAFPIASLALFFGLEYFKTGSFVQASYFDRSPLLMINVSDATGTLATVLDQAGWVARILFYSGGSFMLTVFILLGLFLHWQKVRRRELALFGVIVAFYWTAFSVIGFLPRYVIPVLPYFCIAAAACTYVMVQERLVLYYAFVCLAVLISLRFFYSASASGDFETNMQHKQAADVCQAVGHYLEMSRPSAIVAADWPLSAYLARPELGYVERPLQVIEIGYAQVDLQRSADLLVYFSIGPSNQIEMLRERTDRPPVRRFENTGIFAEVYELPGFRLQCIF